MNKLSNVPPPKTNMDPTNDGSICRNLLFQCLVFRFHVSVWGCKESASWLEELVEDPSVSDLVGDSLKGTPSDVQGRGQWALLYQNR